MITFLDGPAEGQTLSLRRAPLFLRVVQSRNGKWDALDQLDDEPIQTETIHVYAKAEDGGHMHLSLCPRSASGFYAIAKYGLHREQPPDDVARDRERWRAWATEQRDKERAKHPTV